MAMEGHYQSHPDGAPLILFGLPDQEAATVRYSIEIPKASSLVLKHSLDAPLAGLGFWSLWLRWRGSLFEDRWFLRAAMLMTPSGFGAVLFGWFTAEIGRQPFVVYGLLRTADSASPLAAPAVATSLIAFVIVYFAVFAAGMFYILRLMAAAPHPGEEGLTEDEPLRAAGLTPAPAIHAGHGREG
jgi:cytochrome d ubiquinol oxidase subunit I